VENLHWRASVFFPAVQTFRSLRPIESESDGTLLTKGAPVWANEAVAEPVAWGSWGKSVFRFAVLYRWPEVWLGGGRF